jgi:hypothetical protein
MSGAIRVNMVYIIFLNIYILYNKIMIYSKRRKNLGGGRRKRSNLKSYKSHMRGGRTPVPKRESTPEKIIWYFHWYDGKHEKKEHFIDKYSQIIEDLYITNERKGIATFTQQNLDTLNTITYTFDFDKMIYTDDRSVITKRISRESISV